MNPGWPAPIDRIEVRLGDGGTRLPHARLRHLARTAFSGRAHLEPDEDATRIHLLLADELAHLPEALRNGVAHMADRLREARREGTDLPSITFRLLAKGGMLVEEWDA